MPWTVMYHVIMSRYDDRKGAPVLSRIVCHDWQNVLNTLPDHATGEMLSILTHWSEFAHEGDSITPFIDLIIYKVRMSKRGQPASHQVLKPQDPVVTYKVEELMRPLPTEEVEDDDAEEKWIVVCRVHSRKSRQGLRRYLTKTLDWSDDSSKATTFPNEGAAEEACMQVNGPKGAMSGPEPKILGSS